jgi:hypothetical protein
MTGRKSDCKEWAGAVYVNMAGGRLVLGSGGLRSICSIAGRRVGLRRCGGGAICEHGRQN